MAKKPNLWRLLTGNQGHSGEKARSYLEISVWILFCAALGVYFLSVSLNKLFYDFATDESQWIWVSQRYFKELVKLDFKNSDWNQSFHTFGLNSPKIAQYVIGTGLFIGGELDTKFDAMSWDWQKGRDWNWRKDYTPPYRTLVYGRLLMPLVGVGCLLVFLFVITRILSRFSSAIAALVLACSPLLIDYSARAVLDAPAFFFSLLFIAALVAFKWRQAFQTSLSKIIQYSLIAGLCLGLAIGAKLNNLPLIGIWLACLAWVSVIDFEPRFRLKSRMLGRYLLAGFAGLIMALAVFIGSNPYLYSRSVPEFVDKTKKMLELGETLQAYRKSAPAQAIWTSKRKLKSIRKFVLKNNLIRKKAVLYFLLPWGIFFIGYQIVQNFRQRGLLKLDRLVFIAAAALVIFAANFIWVPLMWSRYFMPFLIPFSVISGFAVEGLFELVRLRPKKIAEGE